MGLGYLQDTVDEVFAQYKLTENQRILAQSQVQERSLSAPFAAYHAYHAAHYAASQLIWHSPEAQLLRSYDFIVGYRNPKLNPDLPGEFMVAQQHGPDETGADLWVVIGDDLNFLCKEAISFFELEAPCPTST